MTDPYPKRRDAQTIALLVVAWILSEPGRADRFLSLTGLDADQLRVGLSRPDMLGAAIDFLLGHEPDLLACADAIGESPASIIAAGKEIAS